MINLENYDCIITCHGCESKCLAGFKKEFLDGDEFKCECHNSFHYRTIHRPAMISAYMHELQKCSKLVQPRNKE